MSWQAKPSGAYALSSQEAKDNVNAYYNYFKTITTKNNIVGQLCNINSESGLNPWRWQSDSVSLSGGYGLYQYTPASGYINLTGIPGHSPNMSTSQISGGNVSDAEAQMYVFSNNTLGKWVSTCWRSYWDPVLHPLLYARRTNILNTYGDGSSLSMQQFFTIDNVEDACFAFMACFEGPADPNFNDRIANAQTINDLIEDSPTPPGDLWLYGGIRDVLRRLIIHC